MQQLTLLVNGERIGVYSKPGLPNWNSLSPAGSLLAEHAAPQPGEQVLCIGLGHAAPAAALARGAPEAHFTLLDLTYPALQAAAATCQANRLANVQALAVIEPPPGARFDRALIELPKGRELARRWLAQTFRALRPGGLLFLAGDKGLGVEPVGRDAAELFGPGRVLDYKKGNRVIVFTRPADAPGSGWWDAPGIAAGTWQEARLQLPESAGLTGVAQAGPQEMPLAWLPGVFSAGRLDDGTALLLPHLQVDPGEQALDLGCGSGVIGVLIGRLGAAHVDLVDASLPAAACAAENLARHGLTQQAAARPGDGLRFHDPAAPESSSAAGVNSDGVTASGTIAAGAAGGPAGWAIEPDAPQIQPRYTLIASNPPFHSGKGIDYSMAEGFIHDSRQALLPGGRLLIVANRFIRYDRLIGQVFGRVTTLAEDTRYHVLQAVR
ncbi:MAG: methyltransferase [Chloroflexota bacterium]